MKPRTNYKATSIKKWPKLEFNDNFIKVAFYKHIKRFERKDMLALRFIGLFEVIERVDIYRLALPTRMYHIHNMFYFYCFTSML